MTDPSEWVLLIYLLVNVLAVAMMIALIYLCCFDGEEEEFEEHEVINSDLQLSFFYFDETKGNPCHSQEYSSC